MGRYIGLDRHGTSCTFGLQIMNPAYEGDTSEPNVVARDRWFDAPATPTDASKRTGPVGNGGLPSIRLKNS